MSGLREKIAAELRSNDECSSAELLSVQEYLDDADAILRIIHEHALAPTIPQEAISAAFDRYTRTPDTDDDGITWSTVELMLRDALAYLRPPEQGTLRVFTERDVRELLRPLVQALFKARGGNHVSGERLEEAVQQIVLETPSELTEEVIARSAVVRMLCDATANTWHINSEDPAGLSREDAEAFIGGQAGGVELVKREDADRLVALALLWGAHDYEGLPNAVWDDLEARGFMAMAGGGSTTWPVLTDAGEAYLRTELERDR